MHEIELPPALELADDRLAHGLVVGLHDVGGDGEALLRGRLHRGHVAHMPARAMWSVRGMGVAVSVSTSTSLSHLLQTLLVGYAESLFFIDDDQPQLILN